jgi:hypothetical protein
VYHSILDGRTIQATRGIGAKVGVRNENMPDLPKACGMPNLLAEAFWYNAMNADVVAACHLYCCGKPWEGYLTYRSDSLRCFDQFRGLSHWNRLPRN